MQSCWFFIFYARVRWELGVNQYFVHAARKTKKKHELFCTRITFFIRICDRIWAKWKSVLNRSWTIFNIRFVLVFVRAKIEHGAALFARKSWLRKWVDAAFFAENVNGAVFWFTTRLMAFIREFYRHKIFWVWIRYGLFMLVIVSHFDISEINWQTMTWIHEIHKYLYNFFKK